MAGIDKWSCEYAACFIAPTRTFVIAVIVQPQLGAALGTAGLGTAGLGLPGVIPAPAAMPSTGFAPPGVAIPQLAAPVVATTLPGVVIPQLSIPQPGVVTAQLTGIITIHY